MRLHVEVDAADADRRLTDITGRLDDSGRLLRFLAAEIRDYEVTVFATQGRGSWAPLDADTVEAKGSARVLVDNGDLLADLTRRGAGIERITGESVEVGTDHPGAAYSKKGARGMPKRDPAPKPRPAVVAGWGEDLLAGVVTGRGL